MKTIQVLYFLCLLCPLAKSQDIIIKTDQTEVSAKVTEITSDEVKFKYFNRLDGPTYTCKKSEIFVIIYKDGTREKFNSATVAPKIAPAALGYTDTPMANPAPSASVPVTVANPIPATSEGKRRGWTGGFGYTTPSQGIGNASGITYGGGYYFLGSGRKGGILLDIYALNFFGEGTPNYGIIAVNGLFRTSETSKFYMGGGLGYATASVKLKDRYGLSTTVSSGDFGGKIFMGYGMLQIGMVWPSFQSTNGGELLTAGLYLNPFN